MDLELKITYPDWYDDLAEFEHESKGYLEGVVVNVNKITLSLIFYDTTRLVQDAQFELSSDKFWYVPGLVIVPKVSKEFIEIAARKIAESIIQPNDNCKVEN